MGDVVQFCHCVSVFGVGLVTFLWMIAFPVAVAKSGLSLLQLYYAAGRMVEIDLEERQAQKQQ